MSPFDTDTLYISVTTYPLVSFPEAMAKYSLVLSHRLPPSPHLTEVLVLPLPPAKFLIKRTIFHDLDLALSNSAKLTIY